MDSDGSLVLGESLASCRTVGLGASSFRDNIYWPGSDLYIYIYIYITNITDRSVPPTKQMDMCPKGYNIL